MNDTDSDAGVPDTYAPDSLEDARLYQSVKQRLFGRSEPLQIGPHKLLRKLGAGGMGEVYLAHDRSLDRPIAIKLVLRKYADDPRLTERMVREARALAKLAHPNVVHVYEVGQHEGRIFLAMEYVQGQCLGDWIQLATPRWQDVLDAYLAAGEGLAAAHAAGLVHRDFKPDNVLRGNDGRVLVADFGLACAADMPATMDSDELPPTQDTRLSATGAILGTPSFMPLEQLHGGPLDARADQFAFCVSLYEGLWKTHPFTGSSLTELMGALEDERIVVPPIGGGVPSWIWPIVRRGLSRDRDARWPDMRSLLDALREAPRKRARRRRAAVVLPLALAFLYAIFPRPALSCEAEDSGVHAHWNDEHRARLRDAFVASGSGLAEDAAPVVEAELDRWWTAWDGARRESCEATHERGTQSIVMLDRRSACLERKRDEVESIIGMLEQADVALVANTGKVIEVLPDLDACSLANLVQSPDDSLSGPSRLAIDEGYALLAGARVELAVGRTAEARAGAEQARRLATTLAHLPLELEAAALLADLRMHGGELEQGLDDLRALVRRAELAEQHELVASLRVRVARAAAGDYGDETLQRWLIEEAQLALDRVDVPDDRRAVSLQVARGRVAEQEGDYRTAIEAHERALSLGELAGLEPRELAKLRVGIGTARYGMGDLAGAHDELVRAHDETRSAWGPRSIELARIAFNLGLIAIDHGDLEAAETRLREALDIDRLAWGEHSLEVTRDRFAIANLALARGDVATAEPEFERVLHEFEALLGTDDDETASAINAIAVCRALSEDPVGALQGYRRALAIEERLHPPEHPHVAYIQGNIGHIEFDRGHGDAALVAYDRAIATLERDVVADSSDLALVRGGRALIWLERGDSKRALPELAAAVATLPPTHQARARFELGLARALVDVYGERELATARALVIRGMRTLEAQGLLDEAEARRTENTIEQINAHQH